MVIDRRSLMLSIGAAVATAATGLRPARAGTDLFAAARMNAAGTATLAVFDLSGCELFSTELPARGHDIAVAPDGRRMVVFARRPGNWAAVINRSGAVVKTILAEPGRHFFGHGVFTPDGRILHATENDFGRGIGVVGIYDATDGFRRIGEFESNGVGPHDIARVPASGLLAVANGGIQTHPDTGRDILNRDTMAPNLTLMDVTGVVRGRFDLGPELRLSSLRHIAVASDGMVVFGCQFEGDPADGPPLVGTVSADGTVRLLDMPETDLGRLANYVGSVALDSSEEIIAATCPRGGRAAFWERRSGRYLGSRAHADVCGVVPAGARARVFLLTSGNAGVRLAALDTDSLTTIAGSDLDRWIWDNHMRLLPA